MSDEHLRVGLIGAGNWARTAHLPAFATQPQVQVVGIVDKNPEQVRSLSNEFSHYNPETGEPEPNSYVILHCCGGRQPCNIADPHPTFLLFKRRIL